MENREGARRQEEPRWLTLTVVLGEVECPACGRQPLSTPTCSLCAGAGLVRFMDAVGFLHAAVGPVYV